MRTPLAPSCRRHPRQRQRGATLLEALVAFLVLSLGMLSMARLQNQLRLHADVARQRSEAVRLAQEDLEQLRAFASLATSAGVAAYDDIASGERQVSSLNDQALNTRYELRRQIDASEAPRLKTATVTVSWNDRGGEAQSVALSSVIAGQDPGLSAALSLRAAGDATVGAYGRSAQIPLEAVDLGDGRSAFKPLLAGDIAYLFDNADGRIKARCTGVGSGADWAATLGACAPAAGLLLSGRVRFVAPDGLLALSMSLLQNGSTSAAPCTAEARKNVAYTTPAGPRRETVPLAAAPASVGTAAWTEFGERHVVYTCLAAAPGEPPRWSGRAAVIPSGWTLGSTAADRKVCRYSADQDGSGSIDRNAEHPERYVDVDSTLAEQNFVVLRGDQPCPGVAPGAAAATVQHQP